MINKQPEVTTALLVFMIMISEKSKLLSLKILYQDNLVDRLLMLLDQDSEQAYLSSELISNLL